MVDKNHTGLHALGFVLIHNDLILVNIAPCMHDSAMKQNDLILWNIGPHWINEART